MGMDFHLNYKSLIFYLNITLFNYNLGLAKPFGLPYRKKILCVSFIVPLSCIKSNTI